MYIQFVYIDIKMARTARAISLDEEANKIADELIKEGRGRLSEICSRALKEEGGAFLSKESILTKLANIEMQEQQMIAEKQILNNKLQKLESEETKRKELEIKQQKNLEEAEELKRIEVLERKEFEEANLQRERENQIKIDNRIGLVIKMIQATSDFNKSFSKTCATAYVKDKETLGISLRDFMMSTAKANSLCFDRDNFDKLMQSPEFKELNEEFSICQI